MRSSDSSPEPGPALTRFGMNTPNVRRLAKFYEDAFGAQLEFRDGQHSHRSASWAGIQGGAESRRLRLGDATIELLEFDTPGRPYPPELSPYDTRFQHLAIVVTDMQRAMERLSNTPGWATISEGGPQTLPANDGGVTAFKFRDPDGHPLEFLQFAGGKAPAHWHKMIGRNIYLGIDHSALSVVDAPRSVRFYETLGLTLTQRTLNRGTEQEHLDGVPAPVVDVISLSPHPPTPHVELLCYRTRSRVTPEPLRSHDTAATRLVFVIPGSSSRRLIQDPDGHFLQFDACAQTHPNATA
jgi:catechol 2,3-dioxygenase-like lactoylglutathione lyase family enzyme